MLRQQHNFLSLPCAYKKASHSVWENAKLHDIQFIIIQTIQGGHDGSVKSAFLKGGGLLAVFRAVFQAVDAPPDHLFLAAPRPRDPAVLSSAVTAAEKLGQRILAAVFSSLCFHSLLRYLAFSGSPGDFFLHQIE